MRPPSARPNTPRPPRSRASSPGAIACRSAPATPPPPTASTPRPAMRARCRSGVRSPARRTCILHAAGWLGGGLVASFEKLIIDAEMLQMMAAWLKPPRGRRRVPGPGRHRRGRPWRPFLRHRPHAGPLRDSLLRAPGLRLGQLRQLARPRQPVHGRARQRRLEAAASVVRAAATRPRDRRGSAGLHGPPQARDRALAVLSKLEMLPPKSEGCSRYR